MKEIFSDIEDRSELVLSQRREIEIKLVKSRR